MDDATDFDTWIDGVWRTHADDPAAVAAQLDTGAGVATTPAQLARLVQLGNHLLGEHLGRYADGRAWLDRLRGHAQCRDDAAAAVATARASLALCEADGGAGAEAAVAQLAPADRVRARATAAGHVVERDAPRAAALWRDAITAADALPDGAAPARALAVAGNNIACTLEERAQRSPDERDLMLAAAEAARRWWQVAGGWLEVERAEYRLAMASLAAGDAARAVRHAAQCRQIVDANGSVPFERFYACEAQVLAARAAGDAAGAADALAAAHAAFAALDADDRDACRGTLDRLGG